MDYLEVTAKFDNTGRIIPLSFIWAGRKINIDKVSDMRPAASLNKAGRVCAIPAVPAAPFIICSVTSSAGF